MTKIIETDGRDVEMYAIAHSFVPVLAGKCNIGEWLVYGTLHLNGASYPGDRRISVASYDTRRGHQ